MLQGELCVVKSTSEGVGLRKSPGKGRFRKASATPEQAQGLAWLCLGTMTMNYIDADTKYSYEE